MNAFPEKPAPKRIGTDDEQTDRVTPSEAANQELVQLAEIHPDTFSPNENEAAATALPTIPRPQEARDPAWTGFDVIRLVVFAIVALFIGVGVVLLAVHLWINPHSSIAALGRSPIIIVAGQAVAYVLLMAYMYVLVTRERRQSDFLAAIHWNWPSKVLPYVVIGLTLSFALQLLSHLLPMPKGLPIDTFFSTPAQAWVLTLFGITLAPLMEELFFRGFLYPVLLRGIGKPVAIFFTAFAFALLHGSQLLFAWGPVLVIFLVGMVLTMVRAYKNSVAAGLLIHVAYNGTISILMFAATDGFRHLEKLNQ